MFQLGCFVFPRAFDPTGMLRGRAVVRVLAAALVALSTARAAAEIMAYDFAGQVTSVAQPDPATGFVVGAPITGRFSYDSATPLSSLGNGIYATAFEPTPPSTVSLSAQIGGVPLTYAKSTTGIVASVQTENLDSFTIAEHAADSGGNPIATATLDLMGPASNWFGTPPSLATFNPLAFFEDGLLGYSVPQYFDIDTPSTSNPELLLQATITEMNVVPEPSSIVLAAIGAAFATFACRRKRRAVG